VQVFGSNFQANLTVTVFFPNGGTGSLSGSGQIQNVTSNSFTMVIDFNNNPGSYSIRVNNPNGKQSSNFGFTVQQPPVQNPSVSSISPASPMSNAADQDVTVFGSNFLPNLTVSVTFPSGGGATLSGTQIQSVTPTSFVMRITLGAPGAWVIRVNNPDGGRSTAFNFNVGTVVQQPAITSINPTVPAASTTDQDITVVGSNFQPNLTVRATFPGGAATLSGAQILNVTPTSFVLRITFGAAGSWAIRVTNPDGGQSNNFNLTVVNVAGAPTISSINPASPVSNGSDQNVTVFGNNFRQDLHVNVTFPNGDGAVLQGSGQIFNVTQTSFVMRIKLNGDGNWGIRAANLDGAQSGLFNFAVQAASAPPTSIPTAVLAPVIGSRRVTQSNLGIADGKWEFDQHMTLLHRAGGGISGSNDKFAWDVNLYTPTNSNEDVGQPVYATADGDVVSYAGVAPGAAAGAVLIAHPNKTNPVWWSGYLHMKNIKVILGQHVTASTVIGEIGRAGANNDHLHFVIYYGENRGGGLISFNADINERGTSATSLPTIASLNPPTLTRSDKDQDVTVNGTNFQDGLTVSVGFPGGGSGSLQPPGQILSITPTSFVMRIKVNGEGTWSMRVNNRDGGQSSVFPFNVGTPAASPDKVPLIFIPGIAGSLLDEVKEDGSRENIWPGGILTNHYALTLDRRQTLHNIIAPDVIRTTVRNYPVKSIFVDTYYPLLEMLTNHTKGGYREYKVNDTPSRRTSTGCDLSQASSRPTLFVFAYDWRLSNADNAIKLKDYIGCVQKFYPGTQVDILAHSMGGLIARRHILNPGPRNVRRLVTVATPWLGAPKAINVLETGEFIDQDFHQLLVLDGTIKTLSEFFPGVQELIPSRSYFDLGLRPFGERDWDIDNDRKLTSEFSFDQMKNMLDKRYPRSIPGSASSLFHSSSQDDWSGDQLGVRYFHFYGIARQADTIGKVVTVRKVNCFPPRCEFVDTFDTQPIVGDGTVPVFSARRTAGTQNLNAPGATLRLFSYTQAANDHFADHSGLMLNPNVFNAVLDALSDTPSSSQSQEATAEAIATDTEPQVQPAYYLQVVGSPSVTVTDPFGNFTSPLSDTPDPGLPNVTQLARGKKALLVTIPTDGTYTVTLVSDGAPLSIDLTKGTDIETTQAIRYLDLSLPANVAARLRLSPQSVETLSVDQDGDGIFETTVSPTASVSGLTAGDKVPPVVSINESVGVGGTSVTVTATDVDSGVRSINFSLDGSNFQPFTGTLTLNPSQTPVVYAFADDNVANRSGLATLTLSAARTFQVSADNYAVNEGDGSVNITVTRSGDTSGESHVGYSTGPGTAQETSDYTATSGTLNFGPGESSKTITVLLTDDAFVESNETFTLTLRDPVGASLVAPAVSVVTIKDNDTALSPVNPADDAQFYVRQHYHDFLNREPDVSGLQFWTNEITFCGGNTQCQEVKRINVSAAFFLSIEFQNTGYLVYRLYKSAYGDGASPNVPGTVPVIRLQEFLPDSQRIGQGVAVGIGNWEQQLEANKNAFALEFVQRQRFLVAYPLSMTPAQFVDKLNQNASGVLSQLERDQLVAELSASTNVSAGRASVLRKVAESQALQRNELNRAFVLMQYYGYLRRNPDDPQDTDFRGWKFWLDKLNQFGGNFVNAEMVKAFISSDEYRRRFGQ
jgi:pimeloyl-ACP methyl ester carboxylesterase